MKSQKSKVATQRDRRVSSKAGASRPTVPAKKTARPSGIQAVSKKPVRAKGQTPKPRAEPVAKGRELFPAGVAGQILDELRTLRTVVEERTARPRVVDDTDAGLETAVDSVRRLLSEFIDRRVESLLGDLVGIREAIADPQRPDLAAALSRMDQLLERLGATPISARQLDFIDPAIHEIAAERNLSNLPDGVVVETLRPGWRSAGGALVLKARVAVNRGDSHEPPRH